MSSLKANKCVHSIALFLIIVFLQLWHSGQHEPDLIRPSSTVTVLILHKAHPMYSFEELTIDHFTYPVFLPDCKIAHCSTQTKAVWSCFVSICVGVSYHLAAVMLVFNQIISIEQAFANGSGFFDEDPLQRVSFRVGHT